jgi:hypothetical protein
MKLKHIPTVLLILFIIAYYIWLISVGLWTFWPPSTDYYDQLAVAFQHGQLHILQGPDPRLLQLENPYDPAARSGISTPLDISLYNGKFYLYWGPAPGLILSFFKPIFTNEIGDPYLVFIILTGIFLLETLILFKLKNIFFPNLHHWIILLSIAVAGLSTPYAWMYYNPRVYDAAIASGQFFFLAGFYIVIDPIARMVFLPRKQSSPKAISFHEVMNLVFVGIFWSFVFGSRLTQGMLIAFISIMTVIWFFKRNEYSIKSTLPYALALGLPLTLGLILLGWYNYARFDSVFETGFKYAMAGPYLQSYLDKIFLPAYIPQNLYNYILNPPVYHYPFLRSIPGQMQPVSSLYIIPNVYFSDEITGWVYSTPFTFFALIPVFTLIVNARKPKDIHQQFFQWTIISLLGSFIFALAPLLMFFWLSTRYIMDYMPELILLGIFGFWQGYDFLAKRPLPHIIYSLLGIALAIATIVIGNAIGLSSHTARIKSYNPALWDFLVDFFGRLSHFLPSR